MTNSIRTLFLVTAATLLCTAPTHAAELATNGGFETGDFTGWAQFVNNGTQSISSTNPSSGDFSASLNASGDSPVDTLITMANVGIGMVEPAEMITVRFDARGTAANGGVVFAEFFSFSDGGGVTAQQILGGGPLPLDADADVWTSYEFIVFAGPDVSGGVSLLLKSSCGAVVGCVADIYFDNASIATGTTGEPDADLDLVPDSIDNCTIHANPGQEDADGDLIGDRCDGDYNNDCAVNFADISMFPVEFLGSNPLFDHDSSGAVSFPDYAILTSFFLQPPGPSAPGSLCNPVVNFVSNGGFETGDFTDWSQFVNNGTQSISSINPSSGEFSASLDASGDAPVDTLITMSNMGIGEVSPADRIKVTFDVRGTAANGGVAFAEFFSFDGVGGITAQQILGGGPLPVNSDPDVWTTFEFIVFAGPEVSGGLSLLLKSSCGAVVGCAANLYFDNVTVTPAPL